MRDRRVIEKLIRSGKKLRYRSDECSVIAEIRAEVENEANYERDLTVECEVLTMVRIAHYKKLVGMSGHKKALATAQRVTELQPWQREEGYTPSF